MKHKIIGKALVAACLGALVSSAAIAAKPTPPPQIGGMDVYSAGVPIGKVLGFNVAAFYVAVISSKGYVFDIAAYTGAHLGVDSTLHFAGSACTGDAYSTPVNWQAYQGYVFPAPASSPVGLYYVPRGQQEETRNYASRYYGESCVDEAGVKELRLALPNNPAITGVPNGTFALPIVFGIP